MEAAVAFDFDDLLPTVRRAHSGASRDDAEDAIQTAIAEGLEKGWELTAANVVTRARSRLIDAKRRRDSQHSSLDAFREDAEDSPPVEFAVAEDDLDGHLRLREVREAPVTEKLLDAVQVGGAASVRPRGEAHHRTRYSDADVARVKALFAQKLSMAEVARRTGLPYSSVCKWCRGVARRAPTTAGWTPELAIAACQQFQREEGRRPTQEEAKRDRRLPCVKVVQRLFGTWSKLMTAAGLETYRPEALAWSDQRLLDTLRDFAAQHGRLPYHREMRSANGLPSGGTLFRRFGSSNPAAVLRQLEAGHRG